MGAKSNQMGAFIFVGVVVVVVVVAERTNKRTRKSELFMFDD
jgi:sensor domain CHASE-containing protein